MVKAGELGGVLEVVLARLAGFMEKSLRIKGKVIAALFYPSAVLFVAVAIMLLLLLFGYALSLDEPGLPRPESYPEDSDREINRYTLLGEYDTSGIAQQETVWLNDLPVATVQNSTVYNIYPDHLGTPRAITNAANTVIWKWDSDPFGVAAANEDPDGDTIKFSYNIRFPGQYYDSETGKHYNYFRDYDPGTGRYIESDPIGLDGGRNTFGYVKGSPLHYIDPLGSSGGMLSGNPNGVPG